MILQLTVPLLKSMDEMLGTFFCISTSLKKQCITYPTYNKLFFLFHSAITCPKCILGCIVPVQSLDYNSIWACNILEGGDKGYV